MMNMQGSKNSFTSLNDEKFDANFQEQNDEIVALQAIFNSEEDEKIKVLTNADRERQQIFTLLIIICPQPISDQVLVDIVLPVEDTMPPMAAAAAAAPLDVPSLKLPLDTPLMRSDSGQRWLGCLSVKYLSPLYLLVNMPPTYPSHDPPQFHLQGPWLSKIQAECLEAQLTKLWTEGSQMPVIYTWVNWLENNVLSHLEIKDHLVINPASQINWEDSTTNDAPWFENVGEVIAIMKRYNQQQMDIEFCQSLHECHVCYLEKPGYQFFRMHDCPHNFCHECMTEFCDLHVRDGTVEALRCPDRECNSIIPPYIVQAVLGQEAYQRWEQLLLQKTLDAMSDTVYCPRCSSLVIAEAEEELHLAHCTVCYFSFCTECKHSWHQGSSCVTDEEMLDKIERRGNIHGLSPAEFEKFQELRQRMMEEIESKTAIKAKMKPCPSCRVPVEKMGGCNKMTCKCGKCFCWVCGKAIEGYAHFQKGCQLFPGSEVAVAIPPPRQPPDAVLRIQAQIAVNPELLNNRCYCPTCKQVSLKGRDNNNHIKCWNCKTNFCFQCKSRITGSVNSHFTGPCAQHS